MASYTKQMMDLAKDWLAANPDPESPFVTLPKVPRTDHKWSAAESREKAAAYRALPAAQQNPELLAAFAKLETMYDGLETADADLGALEHRIEYALNRPPEARHEKLAADEMEKAYAFLGRWLLAWARHGYNVFELSPDFTAAMLATDARELDIGAVRLPFRGLLMLIPDGFAKGREGRHYTKIHITETTRGEVDQLRTANSINAALVGLGPADQQDVLRTAHSWLDDRTKATSLSHKLFGNSPRRLTDSPAMRDEVKLLHVHATDGIHTLTTTIDRKDLTWDSFEEIPNDVDFTADREALYTLRQIVFGTLAYATAISTAVTPIATESTRGPRGTGPTAKRWEVGRTIRLDHRLVRAVRSGAREVAFRLKSRHIVRGHYRNQAHGPNRSLRTSKWIAPFWKGPADGAELVHTYKLDGGAPGDGESSP
jgi:hypothetical protein